MKSKLFLLFWLVLPPACFNAQITFQKTFGDSTNQAGYAVKQCFDGGYIITGLNTDLTEPMISEVLIIKTNSFGDTIWTKIIGGPGMIGFDVIQTADSAFVVSGYTYPSSPRVLLIKLDIHGNTLWQKISCQGWGQAVQQTLDGGYITAGDVLQKFDSAGSFLWCRDIPFQALYIIQTADSNFVMSGFSYSYFDSVYLEKTDKDGTTIWRKSFPGAFTNTSNNILAETNDGGYILARNSNHLTPSGLLKTDVNGNSIWTRTWPGYRSTSVIQTSDGGFAIGGYSVHDTNSMILVKTDIEGNISWDQKYFSSDYDPGFLCLLDNCVGAKSIRQTEDKGFILTGYITQLSSGDLDLAMIKTDSFGNVLSTGLAVVSQKNKVIVYPNPFSISTTIQFDYFLDDVELILCNLQGKIVKRMFQISAEKFEIERAGLPCGIYFAFIKNNNRLLATEKIVILDP
ncbi:MAG: T9SS type A sorting domain-containing protein [Bacteroidota bacterium]|nr:T9SS type A sorting domain-containing protein [Bacteroidota bacterium]